MFGQKKHDNEEQLKKLEATIQDYQEKLAKAEETIKQKEIALETIKSHKLSPEAIVSKPQDCRARTVVSLLCGQRIL